MNTWLLDRVRCPHCTGRLLFDGAMLECAGCDAAYEYHDGIPILTTAGADSGHILKQAGHFEKEARARGEYRIEPWQKRYLERLQESYEPRSGDLLIDLGAGSGFMTIELAKLGCTCIACDITLENLFQISQVARLLGIAERVHTLCCDVQQLPIASNIADCLVATSILEHLPEDRRAAAQIDRVCKRSAWLMVSAPISFKHIYPLFWPVHIVHDREMGHLRHYDEATLAALFSDWRRCCVYYTGHFRKVASRLVELRGHSVDWERVEQIDRRHEGKRYGASTVICVFDRES